MKHVFPLEGMAFHHNIIEEIVRSLQKCNEHKDRICGLRFHTYVCSHGLDVHRPAGTHLAWMFVEIGRIHDAQRVYVKLMPQQEVFWNWVIVECLKQEEHQNALRIYTIARCKLAPLKGHDFVGLLKACAKMKDIKTGTELHEDISKLGLIEGDIFVGSALVDMYAKCGLIAKAELVFENLPARNVVTWTALIAGYVEHMQSKQALLHLEQMQYEGISPNVVTFVCCLKACGNIGDLDEGEKIHEDIERMGFLRQNYVIGNALVEMYVKCRSLEKAHEAFSKLPIRDIFSWNTLIAGYAEHGHCEQALEFYEEMELNGVIPDVFTFVWILKACANLENIGKGHEIHAELARRGLLVENIIGSTLVDMYAKCAMFVKAKQVFHDIPTRDIVSWTAMVAGYAEHGQSEKALKCFEQMKLEGVCPDSVTFLYCLKACCNVGAIMKGKELHAETESLDRNLYLRSSLVDMYAKCGLLVDAQEVFDGLPIRDAVLWTTLIAGYCEHGYENEALNCFQKMQLDGIYPNSVTFISCLKACGSVGDKNKCEEIHAEIERRELLSKDLTVGNTLVDMYAKCGAMGKAQEVFDKLHVRDVVSWNALISGYADQGYGEETVKYFEEMQVEGISPDDVTYISSLRACTIMGAVGQGLKIHAQIAIRGLLEGALVVATALVDMYVKCGHLAVARSVFDSLPVRDVALWNSLISGYSQMGVEEDLFLVFKRMVNEGIEPDPITFVIVFNICGHLGLFSKSETYYEAMSQDYGIVPSIEHHARMVRLLGYSGRFDRLSTLIEKMQLCPIVEIQNSVLSSCRNAGNLNLAEHIFNRAML